MLERIDKINKLTNFPDISQIEGKLVDSIATVVYCPPTVTSSVKLYNKQNQGFKVVLSLLALPGS